MNTQKSDLPPVYTRKDFKSDEEYQEYIDIENSDIVPAPITDERRAELVQVAQNTIRKIAGEKIPVGLRLPANDLRRAKSLALQKGVPYQTLIVSAIHQYLDDNLVKK